MDITVGDVWLFLDILSYSMYLHSVLTQQILCCTVKYILVDSQKKTSLATGRLTRWMPVKEKYSYPPLCGHNSIYGNCNVGIHKAKSMFELLCIGVKVCKMRAVFIRTHQYTCCGGWQQTWGVCKWSLSCKDILLISSFRRVQNAFCFLFGDSPASDLYMPTFRNTLFSGPVCLQYKLTFPHTLVSLHTCLWRWNR